MLKKMLLALLLFVLAPLFLAMAILALPLISLHQVYEFARLRWYCWQHGCWTYLVCSPRRAWRDFLENNLLPVLPEDVGVVWTSGSALAPKPLQRVFAAGVGKGKPYFAHVSAFTTRVYPLHQLLQPFKALAGRDESVRQQLQSLLQRELTAFLGAK